MVHHHLAWDSAQLDMRSGQLAWSSPAGPPGHPNPTTVAACLALRPPDEDFTTIKVPAMAAGWVEALVRRGARLIDVEHRLVRTGAVNALQSPAVRCVNVVSPGPLLDLAPEMRGSRFYRDPRIGAVRAERLWRASIRNHCQGRASRLAVAATDGSPVGLIACRDDDDGGGRAPAASRALCIVGVLPHARGRGHAQAMIGALARESGGPLTVEVLASNRGALTLYARVGFRLAASHYVLHIWRDEVA